MCLFFFFFFRPPISHCETESTPKPHDTAACRESTPMSLDAASQTDYNIYDVLLERNVALEKEVANLKEKMKQSDFVRIVYIDKSKIS